MDIISKKLSLSDFIIERFKDVGYILLWDGSQGQCGMIERFLSVETRGKFFGLVNRKKIASIQDSQVFFEDGVKNHYQVEKELLNLIKAYENKTRKNISVYYGL